VTLVVDVLPDVVDAGAGMTLQGEVSCTPACDLRGHNLLIKDETGAEIGAIEITDFDGVISETPEFIVKAPVSPGRYTWLAVCPPITKEGISYAGASVPVPFTVKPHTTSVAVWDIPSAVLPGERFNIKVGVKCSSDCELKNRDFGICNHEGAQVAIVTLSGDRWPGTGLHFAELELEAPAAAERKRDSAQPPGEERKRDSAQPPGDDLYSWTVRCAGWSAGIPHDEGSAGFGIRLVSQPECLVTVETIDRETQMPLSCARVVMHPYRAIADERGVAELRVAKGEYQLFVSQTNYLTFALPVEVTADMTARAELDLEPVPERN
jgi:hypothetical protein